MARTLFPGHSLPRHVAMTSAWDSDALCQSWISRNEGRGDFLPGPPACNASDLPGTGYPVSGPCIAEQDLVGKYRLVRLAEADEVEGEKPRRLRNTCHPTCCQNRTSHIARTKVDSVPHRRAHFGEGDERSRPPMDKNDCRFDIQ
eukprot:3940592-Rhodomonas_salina.1